VVEEIKEKTGLGKWLSDHLSEVIVVGTIFITFAVQHQIMQSKVNAHDAKFEEVRGSLFRTEILLRDLQDKAIDRLARTEERITGLNTRVTRLENK